MILLDSNVLSELARAAPHPAVLAWADAIPVGQFCTTAITEAEMRFGLELLPSGQRRERLQRALDSVFRDVIAGRVLPFDRAAALAYGRLAAERRRAGRGIDIPDLQIAAIAVARGVDAIVTRNHRDFEACGVPLVDPWTTA
ncbi:MAG: type II toxin-antitoxin system VapC family toxin [Alphaproteobacteria bacterium]|nr:type II toxin-antitoxin system VapC family toxin [Rhodospirillales bacterium]MBN9562482.1 type II toxin-antitoxin system VapC family toxin [Alphaproteobacteria bacterium]